MSRVLAIDPGKVRLGLAISDPERRIASPYANYTRRDPEQDARFLKNLIAEENVGLIIIGLPVHLSGREGEQAAAARQLGQWLSGFAGVPYQFFDERYSTHEAEAALLAAGLTNKKRKARRDQVAATIFLQAFLEAGCPTASETDAVGIPTTARAESK